MNIESQIIAQVKEAKSILITSHKSPDGDSVGSSLALYQFLKKINPNIAICHPDPAPKYLQWLPDYNLIVNFEDNSEAVKKCFETADLIFSLDYNEPFRMGEEMGNLLIESQAKKILIDHHLNPSNFADYVISETSSCSTCQLIFQLIENSENINLLDTEIGTPLYLGLVTDSGSFRYNSVKPYTHHVAAKLLEIGVKNDFIHEQIFDVNTPDKLKLRGFATSEKLVILDQIGVAYISLSEEELNQFIHEKGDTEGLVNIALSIEGIKIAAFFSEKEGKVKISFRSKGHDNPINMLAATHFEGGGHANAAGGIYFGKLEDAISEFLKVIHHYVA
ncbi:MAG: DHH family phosphoesterase [Flavobacteriia bacterium]|jgi:phosphoesterase RecJ-like protein